MVRRLQVITNSELETWRTCQTKHGFAYEELLRPPVSALPLSAGNVLHEGIRAGWEAAWSEADLSRDVRLALATSAAVAGVRAEGRLQIAMIAQAGLDGAADSSAVHEATTKLEEAIEVNSWAAVNYFHRIAPELDYVPLAIEAPFRYRIPNVDGKPGIVSHAGKMDLVLYDRTANRIIVQDHKGTGMTVTLLERKLPLDTQLSGYVANVKRLVRQKLLGLKHTTPAATALVRSGQLREDATIGTIAFNVIRRAIPKEPRINLLKKGQAVHEFQKDLLRAQDADECGPMGEVSVAECDTTADVYASALERQALERGLAVTDKQREVLAKLKGKGDSFFAQLEFYRDQSEIDRWRRELLADARRIRETRREPKLRSRNPGACSAPWSPGCAYAALCLSPDDPTVKRSFTIVDRPHQELEESYGEQQEQGQNGVGYGYGAQDARGEW
ncbi:PD-(D/E)XK nuclease superfamily [uncultured Caudovirales phage]|uniref:PD-(D/E)XK nuclease superfamily n=1 Tax=uncultured Caudovirales phage TaxID=2100421 RepID=A0A6J5NDQ4_9CAUD|nr:PD-(D/E)XK nuclease superfamily [uncultured Caudovirales phage]